MIRDSAPRVQLRCPAKTRQKVCFLSANDGKESAAKTVSRIPFCWSVGVHRGLRWGASSGADVGAIAAADEPRAR